MIKTGFHLSRFWMALLKIWVRLSVNASSFPKLRVSAWMSSPRLERRSPGTYLTSPRSSHLTTSSNISSLCTISFLRMEKNALEKHVPNKLLISPTSPQSIIRQTSSLTYTTGSWRTKPPNLSEALLSRTSDPLLLHSKRVKTSLKLTRRLLTSISTPVRPATTRMSASTHLSISQLLSSCLEEMSGLDSNHCTKNLTKWKTLKSRKHWQRVFTNLPSSWVQNTRN